MRNSATRLWAARGARHSANRAEELLVLSQVGLTAYGWSVVALGFAVSCAGMIGDLVADALAQQRLDLGIRILSCSIRVGPDCRARVPLDLMIN